MGFQRMIRHFTALSLPDDLRLRLAALGGGIDGARWVPAENLHITLRFIGEVAEPVADEDVDFKGAAVWSESFKEPEPVFDILAIKDILPHRYPFLLVDKIIEFVPGKKAVGVKKVTTNEEFFNELFADDEIEMDISSFR